MLLFELDNTNVVPGNVVYNDTLNPKIYDEDDNMRPEVHASLMAVAKNFIDDLDLPNMIVHDIILTGSSANYNWTKFSDIDLHLISDIDVFADPHMAAKYFNAAKNVWNNNHNVDIRGLDVEVYVEDNDESHESLGRFSVMNNDWISKPVHNTPVFDEAALNRKVKYLMKEIDALMDDDDAVTDIDHLKTKIWLMRGEGLQKGGEYSVENLAFKVLRNMGYLAKIRNALDDAEDRELSIEEAAGSYKCGWCGGATSPGGNPTGKKGKADAKKVNGKCCPGGSRDYQSQQGHEEEMRINEVAEPSVEDVGAFYAKYKTDDWQKRNGGYPRSGVPDAVDNAGSYGDEAFIEFSFKNTSESQARSWVHGWLKSKRLPHTKIESGQDGDYQDDWVIVYVTYKV